VNYYVSDQTSSFTCLYFVKASRGCLDLRLLTGVSPCFFDRLSTRKYNIEILFAASDLVTLSLRMPKRAVEMNTHPIPDDDLDLDT
jgi:hypothetical protein